MKRCIPRLTDLDHCIEDGQQLAHAGDQRDFLRLSRGDEAVVKALDDRVESNSTRSGPFNGARARQQWLRYRTSEAVIQLLSRRCLRLSFTKRYSIVWAGKVNWNMVPRGSFARGHSRPSCASMIDRQMGRPIPMPVAFVV
jgi:hypothetical protein